LSDIADGKSDKSINDIATHACAYNYYEYYIYNTIYIILSTPSQLLDKRISS